MRHQLMVRVRSVLQTEHRFIRTFHHSLVALNMTDAVALKNAMDNSSCGYVQSDERYMIDRSAVICVKVFFQGTDGRDSAYVPIDGLRDLSDSIEQAHQEVERERYNGAKPGVAAARKPLHSVDEDNEEGVEL